MSGLVSLPMYAAPEAATSAFWAGLKRRLRQAGFEAPDRLTEPTDLDAHWRDPNLLLSQTCGLPFSTGLRDTVQIVGAPHYAALGCQGPNYRSLILVRNDDAARRPADLRGRRAAINDFGSYSGAAQLFSAIASFGPPSEFFAGLVVSGSHLSSLELVRNGSADVAAVDCVTFALAARDQPQSVRGIRIIGRSPSAPGLPLITAKATPPDRLAALQGAVAATLRDPELADAKAGLLITGFSAVGPKAYDAFPSVAPISSAIAVIRSSAAPSPTS